MLNLFSKSSFTFCKLRFLGLRSPKTLSFYTRFLALVKGYFGVELVLGGVKRALRVVKGVKGFGEYGEYGEYGKVVK